MPTPTSQAPQTSSATVVPASRQDSTGDRPSPPLATRVLHVVNGEHFSGAERVQSHLGRCLPRFGVAADFVCVKPGRFAELLRSTRGTWGRRYDAPMKGRLDLRAAWRIRDLVEQHGYQLLHAHTPRSAMVASIAAHMAGVPWVYHVHSPAARDSSRSWTNRLNGWIEHQSLRSCAHVITVSESLRQDCLATGIAPQDVSVVHNGVPAIRPPRASTPVIGGRWVLGMVALMRPRKGLEVVLDALAQLTADGHDVVLRCIGAYETEPYRASIEAKIERLQLADRVEQVGFTDDVPASLAQLDAMVLPSLFGEGLPMVVLESMAAALPVIATRVEGTPEAIRDGVEGLLAQPGDADSLAAKIKALVGGEYDWAAMAEAACRRHQECFSDHAMAAGTAAIYRQILGSLRG